MHPLAALAALAVLAALAFSAHAALACDPTTPVGLAGCVDKARYTEDLTFLGKQPRAPGSEAVNDARHRCMNAFKAAGLDAMPHPVSKSPPVVNIVGIKKGTDPNRKPVLIGAHIDSVPACDGANDNASGAAGVLEMARVLGRVERHAADIYFLCWDAEELFSAGSSAWVEHPRNVDVKYDTVINFEQIGNRLTAPETQHPPPDWFRGVFPEAAKQMDDHQRKADFAMFIWDDAVQMRVWPDMVKASGVRLLPGVLKRGADGQLTPPKALTRSDHAPFWQRQQPVLYITDTGPYRQSGYHCKGRPDDLARVDVDFAVGVVKATVVFAADRIGIER